MRARFDRSSFVHGITSLGVACGLCLLAASTANAQFGQGGQSDQQSQTGQQGQTGQGGTGTGSLGGVAGQLAAPQLMTFGETIDATGGTGFAGRGDASQNFVGGGIQAGQGQTGTGGNQFGGFGGAGAANQFSALNRGQAQTSRGFGQQPTGPSRSERVRPRYRLAFSYSPRANTSVTTQLQTRLSSLADRLPGMDGVQVTLDGQGNATLTGTTGSADSARLAAALARLEPGVRRVENQIQVNGSE